MTREEYNNLLQSDYWKGYSYSIIKERNFTCQDCGREYPNMRNMLQVHHLVYRDANPWSYKPEELIVLCRECHQRRHGIYNAPDVVDNCESIEDENIHSSYLKRRKMFKRIQCLILVSILVVCAIIYTSYKENNTIVGKEIPSSINHSTSTKSNKKIARKDNEKLEIPVVIQRDELIIDVPVQTESTTLSIIKNNAESSIKSFEEDFHAKAVKQAKRAGVSTDGTTQEILERLNHAKVVKQAKRAGVRTDGTTQEILERLNHAKVVKQAKRVGVSTEGTTEQILERIKMKNMENI